MMEALGEVTAKGGKGDDILPMNPEGAELDGLQGIPGLTNAHVR